MQVSWIICIILYMLALSNLAGASNSHWKTCCRRNTWSINQHIIKYKADKYVSNWLPIGEYKWLYQISDIIYYIILKYRFWHHINRLEWLVFKRFSGMRTMSNYVQHVFPFWKRISSFLMWPWAAIYMATCYSACQDAQCW